MNPYSPTTEPSKSNNPSPYITTPIGDRPKTERFAWDDWAAIIGGAIVIALCVWLLS